jgi:hypothetical protein
MANFFISKTQAREILRIEIRGLLEDRFSVDFPIEDKV